MEKITTPHHRVFKDELGIIHVEVIEGAHVDLASMRKLRKIIAALAGGKKELVLADARAHHILSDEAMDFLKRQMIDKTRLATAVVTDKLGVKIMIDYFNTVLKTKSKLKICSSEEEAVKWLLPLLKEVE